MDAETRHTLAATVPSVFVRMSSVFVALFRTVAKTALPHTREEKRKRKKERGDR